MKKNLLITNIILFAIWVIMFLLMLALVDDVQERYKLIATGAIFFATISYMQMQMAMRD